jgi:hypothetical protein
MLFEIINPSDPYTVEELHAMADTIGLKRAWFQDRPGCPHYDLTPRRREKALQNGAIFKPAKEQARERRERRMDESLQACRGNLTEGN